MTTRVFWFLVGVCALSAHAFTPHRLSAQERGATALADRERIQALVDGLKTRLEIPESVHVSIVASNALMMSVKAPVDAADPFDLAVDASFLAHLTDVELEAAIAHELGHVWVFTHFPYLQTEQLANEIAMRVVTRVSLERLYDKVWARGTVKGDIAGFLGVQPAAGLGGAESAR